MDIKISKRKFLYSKHPIDINNAGIYKIMIPNKFYFGKKGFKYCIGYKDGDRVKPLCTSGFVKSFAETKFM